MRFLIYGNIRLIVFGVRFLPLFLYDYVTMMNLQSLQTIQSDRVMGIFSLHLSVELWFEKNK